MLTKLNLLPLALAGALVLALTVAYVAAPESSAAVPLSAAAAPDPNTCAGYPEKRTFVESQGWWDTGPGTGKVGRHVHVGTCFPNAQSVKGTVDFDVRVMLHDNPGTANLLRIAIGSTVVVKVPISMSCPADCTQWYRISLDTGKWAYDGRQELRLTANVKQPDGTRQYQSTGWQVYFANGKPVKNYRSSDAMIARGWYTSFGYANASLESAYPWSPVSGTWAPVVKFSMGSSTDERWMATVDPSFHAGYEGTVIATGSGHGSKTLSIDTRKFPNGQHKLVLLAHDKRSTGKNSGVQVIPFTVAN